MYSYVISKIMMFNLHICTVLDSDDDRHMIKKLTSIEDIQFEFIVMTKNIKKALISNKFNANSLIQQLQALYVTDYKKIPPFDEDMFSEEETTESLWEKLNPYWDIFDYDLLKQVVKICNCK